MSTRERILDAALDLFAEDGVGGTTVAAIERRAGLAGGSGSLYRHFRSKDDVLEATIEREVARLKATVDEERAALPRLPDRRSQLLLEFHQCLHDVQRFDRLLRILQSDPAQTKAAPAIVARVLGLDRGLVAFGAGDGAPDPQSLDPLTVVVVVAALVGYEQLGKLRARPFLDVSADRFIERLVELVVDAPQPPG